MRICCSFLIKYLPNNKFLYKAKQELTDCLENRSVELNFYLAFRSVGTECPFVQKSERKGNNEN